MKKIVLSMAYAFALLVHPGVAFAADSGACYNIDDGDARSYCLARARHDSSTCYSIQQAYLRSQCLAEVRQ